MRRGPVQDRTLPLQREQMLSTTRVGPPFRKLRLSDFIPSAGFLPEPCIGWSPSNKKGGKGLAQSCSLSRFRGARGALLPGFKPSVKRRDWISPMISD
ncbi:unnamed protein product [Amaranthus hypochondriacus]